MTISEQDIELYAARVRPYFPQPQRGVAYDLALRIANVVGSQVKSLRPETTLREILSWLKKEFDPSDSLEQVELVLAVEEELGFQIPDSVAANPDLATFRELVEQEVQKRRVA